MIAPTIRTALLAVAMALPLAAAAQSACQFLQVAQVPLHYAGDGLGLMMSGAINGKPATMLPDTGSGRTYLTRTATERYGLRLRATGDYVDGVAGKSRLYHAKVAEFAVGPVRATDLYLSVIGDTTFAPPFDAIAGAAFLLQSDLEFSLATKELRFFRPQGCGKAWLAYWGQDASVIPFLPHRETTPNPQFSVHINGIRLTAMIDSGASITTITRSAARRAGVSLEADNARHIGNANGVGSRAVAYWTAQAETFKIGDATVHHPEFGVVDAQLSVDVLLGADFLRAHRVLFAMSQEKLYVSYLGGEPFDARRAIKPWMRQEAEAGNADAWYAMWRIEDARKGPERDAAAALAYLERAAALGKPEANLSLGTRLLVQGRTEPAITHLRAALVPGRTGRNGALWLYLAQLRAGAPQARIDLATHFEAQRDWPMPVVDYFLGKIDGSRMLARANTPARACFAANLAQLHEETLGQPITTVLPESCKSLRDRYHDAP